MHAANASQLAEMSMRRHVADRNRYCGHAGVMSERAPAYVDRRRAEAFGSAADAYDRYRPRYPQSLVAALVAVAVRGRSTSERGPASRRCS
jgi:hypothetical protein